MSTPCLPPIFERSCFSADCAFIGDSRIGPADFARAQTCLLGMLRVGKEQYPAPLRTRGGAEPDIVLCRPATCPASRLAPVQNLPARCESRCWSPCVPKPISRVALHHHLPAQNLRCEAVALCDGRRLHTRQVRRPRQLPDDMGRKSAPDCCALRCPPLARPWALPPQRSNLDS